MGVGETEPLTPNPSFEDISLLHFLSSRWFKVSLSLGLLFILFSSVEVAHLVRQLRAARLDYVGLAFCGYLLGQVASAYRWRLLARPLGFGQPLKTFIAYYFAGMYLNLFAPSVVAGDVGRGYLLAHGRARLGAALHSVLADRVSGLVMLVWVSAGGFLLWGPSVLPVELYYGVLATTGGSIVIWWGLPCLLERCTSPGNIVRRSVDRLSLPYRADLALLGSVCGLSVCFHLFQLGLHAVVAAALGLAVPLWYLVLFIPVVQIFSALPVSFGGLGIREGGYVLCLALWGTGRDEALAFGLVWSAIVLGANICGGLAFLVFPEVGFSTAALKKTLDESE